MKRDRFRCTYCGVPGTDAELEIDHVVPVASGGSNHVSNLTTACRACNQRKGSGSADCVSGAIGGPGNGLLAGWWIHTLNSGGWFQSQGKIFGAQGGFVLVQLFSWWNGESTGVEKIPLEVVYSDRVKLYTNREDFMDAADREFFKRYKKPPLPWREIEKHLAGGIK